MDEKAKREKLIRYARRVNRFAKLWDAFHFVCSTWNKPVGSG